MTPHEDYMSAGQGPATDKHNDPVVDPTKNVLDLVRAAISRQDDLRRVELESFRVQLDLRSELFDARFDAIQKEFDLIESRRVEQKVDTKVAVDAALSAAEKAVKEQTVASEKSIIKSETSAAEQSKQQNATFTAALKGVTDVLADVKERVGRLEARSQGVGEAHANQRLDIGTLIAVLALFAVVAGLLFR